MSEEQDNLDTESRRILAELEGEKADKAEAPKEPEGGQVKPAAKAPAKSKAASKPAAKAPAKKWDGKTYTNVSGLRKRMCGVEIEPKASVTLTDAQLENERLVAKFQRQLELGILAKG